MTLNDSGEDGISVVFGTNGIFVSSTSHNPSTTTSSNNNNNNNYEPLAGNMLDAEQSCRPGLGPGRRLVACQARPPVQAEF
jgi:hypothetical protein